LKFCTEMYSYISSFAVVMNQEFWNKLPPDLQALVSQSMTGVEKEVGEAWDNNRGSSKAVRCCPRPTSPLANNPSAARFVRGNLVALARPVVCHQNVRSRNGY
jgi:hypothetical protein